MTIVGDVAQATGAWAPATWAQVVEHLPVRRGWRLSELTVNYRTPAEIMVLAGRVLDQVAPGMRPPESVRSTGVAPKTVAVGRSEPFAGEAQLAASLAAAIEVAGGTAAVIAPPSLVAPLAAALQRAGLDFGTAGRDALDRQLTLLSVEDAKGLEFDVVNVVEPARVVAESPQRLRALYVAFTRATQRLVIVHSEPLPAVLGAAAQHSA
jgi:DNA helicase IV